MRKIGMEIKIILFIVVFTLLITAIERYQFSQNIVTQFVSSTKAKNRLLLNTIMPIVGLDLSLGLNDATKDYLNLIVKQNNYIKNLLITDDNHKVIFQYPKNAKLSSNIDERDKNSITRSSAPITDNITKQKIGHISIEFYDNDYEKVVSKNRATTFKIFLVTFLLLVIFIYLINLEFRHLRRLTRAVLLYDPKRNNFNLQPSKKRDEVSIIHNAIIKMVQRIHLYTNTVEDLNSTLEEKIKQRTKELEEANKQLQKLSTTDPLTQVGNRRYFEKRVQEIYSLAVRTKKPISLIMCDIDYFKKVNDTYGHTVGDEVLKNVANLISSVLKRSTDVVARFGGEEFIIVLYDTDAEGAKILSQEIRRKLQNPTNFQIGKQRIEPFTLSFGISSITPKQECAHMQLLKDADTALYQAKESGRNRTVIFNS